MNNRQRAVLLAAVVFVTIMLLFPPWYTIGGKDDDRTFYRGYHFLNAPPGGASRIDYPRYLSAIALACFVAALAFLELQNRSGRAR
ncbi:MAG: hypothetical protein NTW97_00930 [Candidatus Krumholzibacteria bacterium]|nr:hypothetical protein [Candidatus Krumholzibacteria bacterium]